ncbi:MAG: alginate lyase family protein [Nitrosomonas sp.]|nr:alginate lyase family protein [Nitrosomonas sp.]MDP1949780.1 alginate lyase family protein [Nitrosomonas sp.]
MTSFTWKFNRLRQMNVPEVLWRLRQLAQKQASLLGLGLVQAPPAPVFFKFGASFVYADTEGLDVPALCVAAEEILAGRWNVFAMRGTDLGFPPKWNRDPKTGIVTPMMLGKQIDYRNEQVAGDIKYLWEPSRHLELVTLALAWNTTGERRYAEGARQLLQSWLDQCPYPQGVHWTSSLELAVRLLNWAFAWQLLGGASSMLFEAEQGKRFLRQWLDAIYQHCHFINGYFSRYSSANNHLMGEYMGLFVASLNWPCWPESAMWQEIAMRGLEAEALKQNTADGVNKEQAVYYQHEVMDMMLLSQCVGRVNGVSFSPAYMERLEKLAEFIAALMDVQGNVPMIGDADDAQMVRLSYEDGWCPYRSLLASCAVLFGRADFKQKALTFDDKNRWLLGATGLRKWDALDPVGDEQPVMAFPEGGYYLLGHRFGRSDEVRIVADCAPLGYLSIAAHGHADALAFTLSIAGEEMLIDPGTFSYHTQKTWRNYFRSTAAHNSLRVDGKDQSEIGGNFMWLRKAQACLIRHDVRDDVQVFEGEHDGYSCLDDPVLHRRQIEFDPRAMVIVVTDLLTCSGKHGVELYWHFGESCKVSKVAQGLLVQSQFVSLQMTCSCNDWPIDLFRGSERPVSGWVSRSFDVKSPITTAIWRGSITGTVKMVTQILINIHQK